MELIELTVTEEFEMARLDQFLAGLYPKVNKSRSDHNQRELNYASKSSRSLW